MGVGEQASKSGKARLGGQADLSFAWA